MEVLGRRLDDPFDAFWDAVRAGDSSVRRTHRGGPQLRLWRLGRGQERARDEPAWASLPDDDLAYHVAHELAHLLLRARRLSRWRRPAATHLPAPRRRVSAGDLQEMIDHAALSEILGPFGFRNDFILDRTADGASRGLASSPVPEPGTAWFATWAIRYCDLSRDLGPERWPHIEALYRERAPAAAELGERLVAIVEDPRLRLTRQGAVGDAAGAGGAGHRSTGSPGHRPGWRSLLEAARLSSRLGYGLYHGLDVAVGEGPASVAPLGVLVGLGHVVVDEEAVEPDLVDIWSWPCAYPRSRC